MVSRRVGVMAVVLGAAAMALGGCGGDDGGGGDGSGGLAVEMRDFEFAPDSFEVTAGQGTPLDLSNSGAVVHELAILSSPIGAESEFEEALVIWEEEVAPGEAKSVTIPSLEAGNYQVICAIQGHFTAGMVGEVTVTDG